MFETTNQNYMEIMRKRTQFMERVDGAQHQLPVAVSTLDPRQIAAIASWCWTIQFHDLLKQCGLHNC
jgi:hypothetical protein